MIIARFSKKIKRNNCGYFPHTAVMKKILKTIPCLLVAAFTLVGACACQNGVTDIRNRERQLRERMREEQQRRFSEHEEQTLEEIDPNFTVDPECPDCPKCPDCPDIPENPEDENRLTENGDEEPQKPTPEHGRVPHRRGHKPKPVPYPLPHN